MPDIVNRTLKDFAGTPDKPKWRTLRDTYLKSVVFTVLYNINHQEVHRITGKSSEMQMNGRQLIINR